jgi:hypothetical protein
MICEHEALQRLATQLVVASAEMIGAAVTMRARPWNTFQEIGQLRKARAAAVFVVECAGADEIKFRSVICERVDLTKIQLDHAHGLVRRLSSGSPRAQTGV